MRPSTQRGVGWGGDVDVPWTCTHAGCYATVFVLSFAHMLDATPVMGWGGVGMLMFLELAHMLDATQLCLSCLCTHAGCYTCHGVGWVWDVDVPWTCTHAGCYATVFVLSLHTCWMLRLSWGGVGWGCWRSLNLHTCWMLRNCVCLVIAHMLDATHCVWELAHWNLCVIDYLFCLCRKHQTVPLHFMASESFSIMVSPHEVSGW